MPGLTSTATRELRARRSALEARRGTTGRGFTLLELIVVLLILGILAAIAVPTYNTVQTNSVKRSVTQTAQAIVRNANAIAASDSSLNGVAVAATITSAATEAGIPTTYAASGVSYAAGTGVTGAAGGAGVRQISGNIQCNIYFTLTSGKVGVGTATCP